MPLIYVILIIGEFQLKIIWKWSLKEKNFEYLKECINKIKILYNF